MSRPGAAPAIGDDLADAVERVARHGDRQAFARLYLHFAPRIKGYLMRLGADGGLAEDLAQEVLLTVWRKAALFDRRQSSAATWIYTIARNRRIDVLRRETRPALDPEDPALVPAPLPAADLVVEEGRRDAELRAAIADLPPEQADLMRLAFVDGKSHVEIAEARKLPLGTVKSRIRLAFNRLRRAMERYR